MTRKLDKLLKKPSRAAAPKDPAPTTPTTTTQTPPAPAAAAPEPKKPETPPAAKNPNAELDDAEKKQEGHDDGHEHETRGLRNWLRPGSGR